MITPVDGASDQAVIDAITATVKRAEELELLDIDSTPSVKVNIESIPTTADLDIEE